MALINLQIGKNGLTQEFLANLKHLFENAEHARISVLKSGTRDRQQLKEWATKITEFLGKNYTAKNIGFTIVLRKWRPSFDRDKVKA